ncbi:hypothetical protein OHU11_39295 [Streptomyces sp. NBC_00257]|uniref:hypothetical protein n=1 Tax=unclassified Streptomyces TaxID=2593676 RepID=UPI00225132E6|nr:MULTISPECIES: hypothetical protein [unclassified Streptomyces]WTB52334.1 hypothetical protein OG832_03760 [Streptomyces sp. NBC_00826]WTH94775.1 hypothetical protein OIC43_39925 [Streptomyces sp. NBC_00825]WTI03509.1 hypothetical protein OHA23_39900 [Streptomyces sp. NBC_00822]MCX4869074.1 hypothetical protein [Streptomyces sp. NBC_00906]MCX4900312.1 hypothetical protein [Streptomyces sp. NBC_00892]
MAEDEQSGIEPRSFLTYVTEVAQLLGVGDVAMEPKDRHARHLAHAVRKPLLERASLPEKWFAPLVAAAVYDPDPSFCRWFVEPAVYAFGRRRVMAALVDYLRVGTDAERAGAVRAWYCAHLPLRADRSPAYGPGGVRDPALDESQDIKAAWLEASLRVFTESTNLQMRHRVLLNLPTSRSAYPPSLHKLLESALTSARAHPDPHIRRWATAADHKGV